MSKPRALQQSQMLSEVAEDSGLSVANVKRALESYEKVATNGLLNGKKVPLPGSMGYLYFVLSRTKKQEVHLELSNTHADILPKLRTIVAFSKPWREFINSNPRTASLIIKLLKCKNEGTET